MCTARRTRRYASVKIDPVDKFWQPAGDQTQKTSSSLPFGPLRRKFAQVGEYQAGSKVPVLFPLQDTGWLDGEFILRCLAGNSRAKSPWLPIAEFQRRWQRR